MNRKKKVVETIYFLAAIFTIIAGAITIYQLIKPTDSSLSVNRATGLNSSQAPGATQISTGVTQASPSPSPPPLLTPVPTPMPTRTPTQTQQTLKSLYKGIIVQTGDPQATEGMNVQFDHTSTPLSGIVWYDSFFTEGTIFPASSYITGNRVHFVYQNTLDEILTFDGSIQQDNSLEGSYTARGITYGTWHVYPA